MLECVIFDLDGLMVDSEPSQFQAWREAFAHFDIEPTLHQQHTSEASRRRWKTRQPGSRRQPLQLESPAELSVDILEHLIIAA